MKKRFLLFFIMSFVMAFVGVQASFGESVNLVVDGEVYTKPMPTSLDEAKDMIRSMADMYNDLSKSYTESHSTASVEREKYLTEISKLKSEIVTLKSDLKETSKDIKDGFIVNNKFTHFISVGPLINNHGMNGVRVGYITDYRAFNNFHVGLNPSLDLYDTKNSNDGSKLDYALSIGLVLGVSIW